jgi:hypothetical protein
MATPAFSFDMIQEPVGFTLEEPAWEFMAKIPYISS